MSTTTGATPERIERAAFKYFKNPSLTSDNYGEYAEYAMGEAVRFASALVTADECIVRRDDLRVILKKALESPNPTRESDAAYDRLRAAISGPELPLPESDVRRNDAPYIETC